MCSRDTVRASSHISFFCGRDPFCEVVRRPENTHEELTVLLEWPAGLSFRGETSGPLPFVWATTGSLPAGLCFRSQITDLILSFQVTCGNINILFAAHIFCLWLVIGTYILPFFFGVIRWSYLRTEISVTLSIGIELYSSPSSFPVTHFVDVILRSHWICKVHPRRQPNQYITQGYQSVSKSNWRDWGSNSLTTTSQSSTFATPSRGLSIRYCAIWINKCIY